MINQSSWYGLHDGMKILYHDTGFYRSGEDRLIMIGIFNGNDVPTYDNDDIHVLKLLVYLISLA